LCTLRHTLLGWSSQGRWNGIDHKRIKILVAEPERKRPFARPRSGLEYSKGKKVKLSLCLTKHHAMMYWGSEGIAPRWKWVASFTPLRLYPQGKSPRYPLEWTAIWGRELDLADDKDQLLRFVVTLINVWFQ